MTADFTSVGVVGLGTMGVGIAQVAAATGALVTVVDTSADRIDAGMGRLRDFVAAGVSRGKLTEDVAAAIVGRVSTATEHSALAGCDLVIECVPEDRELKAQVLGSVSGAVGEGAAIVSNTSTLSITELARSVTNPRRFAGVHFFNPAPLMPLVEIVSGYATDPELVDRLTAWLSAAGKQPVAVKDQPGFLVNSLFIPYINQAIREYDDGLASADDLDTAIKLGLGYPQGPLELLDRLGLDTHLLAAQRAYEDTAEARYAPPPLLRRLVAAGRLGDKTGGGIRPDGGES